MQDETHLARSRRARFVGDSLRYAPSVLIPAAAGAGCVTTFNGLLRPGNLGGLLRNLLVHLHPILVIVLTGIACLLAYTAVLAAAHRWHRGPGKAT